MFNRVQGLSLVLALSASVILAKFYLASDLVVGLIYGATLLLCYFIGSLERRESLEGTITYSCTCGSKLRVAGDVHTMIKVRRMWLEQHLSEPDHRITIE